MRTLVESGPSLLSDNPSYTLEHVILRPISARDMHPALHGDIGVSDACGKEFPNSTQVEGIPWHDSPPLLQHILELFKDRVLQYWIYDQHQRR